MMKKYIGAVVRRLEGHRGWAALIGAELTVIPEGRGWAATSHSGAGLFIALQPHGCSLCRNKRTIDSGSPQLSNSSEEP